MISILDIRSIKRNIGMLDRTFDAKIFSFYGFSSEDFHSRAAELDFLEPAQDRAEYGKGRGAVHIHNEHNETIININLLLRAIMPGSLNRGQAVKLMNSFAAPESILKREVPDILLNKSQGTVPVIGKNPQEDENTLSDRESKKTASRVELLIRELLTRREEYRGRREEGGSRKTEGGMRLQWSGRGSQSTNSGVFGAEKVKELITRADVQLHGRADSRADVRVYGYADRQTDGSGTGAVMYYRNRFAAENEYAGIGVEAGTFGLSKVKELITWAWKKTKGKIPETKGFSLPKQYHEVPFKESGSAARDPVQRPEDRTSGDIQRRQANGRAAGQTDVQLHGRADSRTDVRLYGYAAGQTDGSGTGAVMDYRNRFAAENEYAGIGVEAGVFGLSKVKEWITRAWKKTGEKIPETERFLLPEQYRKVLFTKSGIDIRDRAQRAAYGADADIGGRQADGRTGSRAGVQLYGRADSWTDTQVYGRIGSRADIQLYGYADRQTTGSGTGAVMDYRNRFAPEEGFAGIGMKAGAFGIKKVNELINRVWRKTWEKTPGAEGIPLSQQFGEILLKESTIGAWSMARNAERRASADTGRRQAGGRTDSQADVQLYGHTDRQTGSQTNGQLYGNTDRQTSSQTNGQAYRYIDRQTSSQTNGQLYGNTDRQTSSQTNGQAYRYIDRQTSSQTDGQLYGHTDRQTNGQTYGYADRQLDGLPDGSGTGTVMNHRNSFAADGGFIGIGMKAGVFGLKKVYEWIDRIWKKTGRESLETGEIPFLQQYGEMLLRESGMGARSPARRAEYKASADMGNRHTGRLADGQHINGQIDMNADGEIDEQVSKYLDRSGKFNKIGVTEDKSFYKYKNSDENFTDTERIYREERARQKEEGGSGPQRSGMGSRGIYSDAFGVMRIKQLITWAWKKTGVRIPGTEKIPLPEQYGGMLLKESGIHASGAADNEAYDEVLQSELVLRNGSGAEDGSHTGSGDVSSGTGGKAEESSPKFKVINENIEDSIIYNKSEVQGSIPDVAKLAEQVYKRLEDRLRVERQRRGLFR